MNFTILLYLLKFDEEKMPGNSFQGPTLVNKIRLQNSKHFLMLNYTPSKFGRLLISHQIAFYEHHSREKWCTLLAFINNNSLT